MGKMEKPDILHVMDFEHRITCDTYLENIYTNNVFWQIEKCSKSFFRGFWLSHVFYYDTDFLVCFIFKVLSQFVKLTFTLIPTRTFLYDYLIEQMTESQAD